MSRRRRGESSEESLAVGLSCRTYPDLLQAALDISRRGYIVMKRCLLAAMLLARRPSAVCGRGRQKRAAPRRGVDSGDPTLTPKFGADPSATITAELAPQRHNPLQPPAASNKAGISTSGQPSTPTTKARNSASPNPQNTTTQKHHPQLTHHPSIKMASPPFTLPPSPSPPN